MRGCQDCSPGTCFYDWYIWCWWHDVSVTVQDDDVDVEDDDVVCNEVICTDPSTLSTIIWFWLSWAVMRQESVSRACSGHLQSKLQIIRCDKRSRELLPSPKSYKHCTTATTSQKIKTFLHSFYNQMHCWKKGVDKVVDEIQFRHWPIVFVLYS